MGTRSGNPLWKNGETGGTPITATALQNIEDILDSEDTYISELIDDSESAISVSLKSTYEARVTGGNLAAALAGLPAYTPGQPLRKLTVKPGTYTLATTLTIPSGVHIDARGAKFISALAGTSGRLVTISGVTDVEIEGGTWDGDKASFAEASEQRHNFFIIGAGRVRLHGLASINAKGDGIYVGDDATPCSDITVESVRCDSNHRNGLALIAVNGFRANSSQFVNATGAHPMSGVDIEANLATTVLDDIVFTACNLSGNAQYGAMVSQPNPATARQGGITFNACTMDRNGTLAGGAVGYRQGLRLHAASQVRIIGGQIRENADEGILTTAACSDIQIIGTEIARNGKSGVYDYSGTTRLSLTGLRVQDNSQAVPGAADGINIDIGTGIGVTGCVSTGATQRYGVRTGASASYLNLVGGSFAGNGTGETSLSDNAATRFRADRTGVATFGAIETARAAAGDAGVSVKIAGDAQARLLVRGDGDIRFGDGATAGDTRLYRSAADTLRTNDTFIADVALSTAGTIASTATAGTGYVELREQTVAPGIQADRGRLFVRDNGAGKSQLVVQLGVGTAQILATEP